MHCVYFKLNAISQMFNRVQSGKHKYLISHSRVLWFFPSIYHKIEPHEWRVYLFDYIVGFSHSVFVDHISSKIVEHRKLSLRKNFRIKELLGVN